MSDLIVLGASGYVGTKICSALDESGIRFLRGLHSSKQISDSVGDFRFDLCDPSSVLIDLKAGDTVVLLAAISSPDACKLNYDLAYLVNVLNTRILIKHILNSKARVIFASTDAVFGSSSEPVYEESEKAPAGDYPTMKSEVEDIFLGCKNFLSVRFSYVWSTHDKFSLLVRDYALRGKVLDVYDGFSRSVVHIDDVVEGLMNLCLMDWNFDSGVVNFAGPQMLSRVEMAQIIKQGCPKFNFQVQNAPPEFWVNRPKEINMKSWLFADILKRAPINYELKLEL